MNRVGRQAMQIAQAKVLADGGKKVAIMVSTQAKAEKMKEDFQLEAYPNLEVLSVEKVANGSEILFIGMDELKDMPR